MVKPDYRGPFIKHLAHVAKLARVRIVITMRADFYHRCLEWDSLAELLRTGSYPLATAGIGALHEMNTRPAERAGLRFETGLAERILDDINSLLPESEPQGLSVASFLLGWLYPVCQGDYSKAIEYYSVAIKLKLDNPVDESTAYNNRGLAYSQKGEYDQAIEDYDRAIELKADDAKAYANRGEAYIHKGEHDQAIG